jgi:drug/metabolite transporter (DMT)-like permease
MLKGPLLMLAGIGLFGLLDAISKVLSAEHGVWQVLLVRFATILLAVALLRLFVRGWGGSLRVGNRRLHALRAVVMLGSAVSFFMAFSTLPLVEGYLVFFTSPFFVLALSALTLKERPARAAWAWVAVGFAGVAIGLAPGLLGGLGGSLAGYGWALAGTLFYSAVFVLNRGLRGERGVAALLVWPAALGFVVMLGPGLAGWVAPGPLALGLMMGNGLLVALATVSLALAFRHATASRLAPFGYSGLVWSLAYDLVLFGHLPGWTMLLGAAVVVLACVMSERAAQKPSGKPCEPSASSGSCVAESTAASGRAP